MKKSKAYYDALDRVFTRLESMTAGEFEILLNRQDILNLDYLKLEAEVPEEIMSIHSKTGTKVRYLDYNGTDYDREQAKASGLVKGEIYTVMFTEVGSWSSEVILEEVPGGHNTVMFSEVKD